LVLVAFATKKTKKHYVGVIISVNKGHHTVKFARKVKSTSTFIWPQTDDISDIESEDVSAFLPEPVEGRGSGMTFPVSSSGLHMCVKICVLFALTKFVTFSVTSLLQVHRSLIISMCLSLF
jgi:hypothetical protein